MPLLDIFKKKKEKKEEKKPIEKKAVEKKPRKTVAKKKAEVKAAPVKEKKVEGEAYRILKSPHVSEKATDLAEGGLYIFRVLPGANKAEVKKAVEGIYGVNVLSVRIVNIPRRKRRLGRIHGWKKGYKKALVRLKPGQTIEVLPR